MKNILLLYPDMLFYKVPIFNKLTQFLEKRGYRLIIWYTRIEDHNGERSFNYIPDTIMTLENYTRVLKEHKIDAVINILFKRDPGYLFYYLSLLKTKAMRIPLIFYGHGVDMQKDQWWRNTIYNLTHLVFDGIILYTPGEISKLWRVHHRKITIANNTLDIENRIINSSREQLKLKYKINESKVILTTGRLHSRKKIELLGEIFLKNYKNSAEVAWVIVGSDMSEELRKSISGVKNIYYMGAIYDKNSMAELFSISDLYCIPGAMGLGIVEAFYWGLPVLTISVNHAPEAFYLRNNFNSLLAKDNHELGEMIDLLITDDEMRKTFSANARKVFNEEATLDKMFEGFYSQLNRFFNETVSTEYQKEFINY